MSQRSPRSQSPRCHYESLRNEESSRQKRVFDEIQRQAEEELENAQRVLCEAEGNASRNYSRAKSNSPHRKPPCPEPPRPCSVAGNRQSSPGFSFMFESTPSFDNGTFQNDSPERCTTLMESTLPSVGPTTDSFQYVPESSYETAYSSMCLTGNEFEDVDEQISKILSSERPRGDSPVNETVSYMPFQCTLETPSFGNLSSIRAESSILDETPGTVAVNRIAGPSAAAPSTATVNRPIGPSAAAPGTVTLDRAAGPSAVPPGTVIVDKNDVLKVAFPETVSVNRDGVVRVFPPNSEMAEKNPPPYGGAPGQTPLGRRKGIVPRKLVFTDKDGSPSSLESSSCPDSSLSPLSPSTYGDVFEGTWTVDERTPTTPLSTTQYIRSPRGTKKNVVPRKLNFTEDDGVQSSYGSSGSPYSIDEALSYGDDMGATWTYDGGMPPPSGTLKASTPLEAKRCRIREGTFPMSPVIETVQPQPQPQSHGSRVAPAGQNTNSFLEEQTYKSCFDRTSRLGLSKASEYATCESRLTQSGSAKFYASSCPSSYPSGLEPCSLFSTDISAGSDETPGQKLRKLIEKGVHQELEEDLPPNISRCSLKKKSPDSNKFPKKPQLNQDQIQLLIQMESYDVESAQQIVSDQKKTYKKPCPKQQKAQMDVKHMVLRHGNQPSTSQACEGDYPPMIDPNPEDISPEVAAAMMFSQEKGIKMESCPAETIQYLFPDEPRRQFVSVVDPQQKGRQDMMEKSVEVPSEGVSDSAYTNTMKNKGEDVGSRKSYDLDMALAPEKREYVLVAQKPQRFNQIQFRGNLPEWFPGYLSAFPDQPEGIKLVPSPFGLFQKAWMATNPKNIPANDVVVVD